MTAAPRSSAEILLAVQLEQAGIPFEREYEFAASMGRKWRADFAVRGEVITITWPARVNWKEDGVFPFVDWKVLVEIDGGAFVAGRHSRGEGVEKDAEKQSAAAILGYRVIRCTPRQVESGTALEWIRKALGMEVAA